MMKEKSHSQSSSSTSWIVLNSKGHCSIVDMDKHRIMNLAQIHYRDFRILDPLLSYPSAILGREKAILLNLEHIKAIITSEEVFLRDPRDENVVPVVEELKRRLAHYSTLQFQALEVALEAICSYLAARTTELEMVTYLSLEKLTNKISSLNLDCVRKLKCTTSTLTAKVHKVRDELERLLDDDQDMADLCLSRKLLSPVSISGAANKASISPTSGSKISSLSTIHGEENDVKELEMLLEAYFVQIDRTLEKLINMKEYIDGTEDYINIQIDSRRNKLIKWELVLSSGNLCLAIFALMTNDIFGLSFPYNWNKNHGFMFKWVIIVTAMCTASLFFTIIAYARKKGLL
ncbi:magnesium transporter MRS2-I-like isoform X2 [Arachis stenosperma]|uniref:magnesium transporter MRS2-I-like isoform X2 n=1 Tax=Arachis stenosperma TaxID=217475 RepID=UPI0025ACC360|nr:magnesium transporter MRS2-I-like isoform X2 [Arachis stenosperma]